MTVSSLALAVNEEEKAVLDCTVNALPDCPASASFFAHLLCYIDHHFVAWWKAASIVVTAALGILGLVRDFKVKKTDPETHQKSHRISLSGWVLLAGLIVSAALGVAAQLKETHDEDAAERCRSQQTLSIVENTSNAIKLMSTLAGSSAEVTYLVKCTPAHIDPCPEAASHERLLAKTQIEVYFYTNSDSAKRFTEGSNVADLEWLLSRNGPATKDTFGELVSPGLPDRITVHDYRLQTLSSESTRDTVWSVGDLPGSTVFIQADGSELDSLPVDTLKITIKDGESVVAGPFKKILVAPIGSGANATPTRTAYRYDFPGTIRPVVN